MQPLIDLFGIKDFIPHGYCLSWSPVLLWLHVISDLVITIAYYSIPLTLVYFIRQRKDFPYPWLVALFAGFIVACGTTHLLSAITVWIPLYWLDGWVKGFTAIISLASAVLMLWLIPRALSLPSAAQLQAEILQRKSAEAALLENEHKLSTILDNVEAFIYIKDCNYRYQYVNQPVLRLLGKTAEDIIGKSDDVLFDEATTLKLRENDRRVIELGERIAYENKYTLKDKAVTRTYLSIKQPLRHEDGSIYGLCGISTDIDERKQMETKLRDSEALSVSILNSLTSHLAVLDAQGVIIAINNAWRKFAQENGGGDMLGFNYLAACKNAFNQPDGDEAGSAYAGIAAVLKGELASFHLEYPCHSPTQQRWFEMTVLPLQGSHRGAVVKHLNITGRKRAGWVLNQLKAMIDISLDGFWIVDLSGKLLQVNEAYAKISGYSIDELVNMHVDQLEALENPEQIQAHIAKVIVQGYDQFETRHRHKDGHLIDVEISAAFLPEFQQLCLFCRDITERKQMENELKASEAKFRSIIEVSPVPIALNDDQMNITFLNPAFVQTFGYTLDDIPTLADWWPKAYPDPNYRLQVKAIWQTTLEKAKKEKTDFPPLELVIRCKDNRFKTVLASAAAIQPNFAGEHLIILYDITRHKQIEAKLNAIFNASVEGFITVDMSDTIVSANAAVETIFGYKPEELIGCGIDKLMPTSSKENHEGYLAVEVKSGCQIQEVECLHKNGSVVPVDQTIAEYSIDDAHYFTYIVRDVSLRKTREQQDKERLNQLAHVTRLGLMGEMASGIAHEVNQPLSAISSYTQVSLNLLNTENPDLIKLAEILHKTQQQALRAGGIIHRMRDFVKSQSKHSLTTDINTLINNAVSLCNAELKHKGIKLAFEPGNDLPPIYVDPIHIEQVIINLIRNSADALETLSAKQHRHINIRSRLALNKTIQVSIKDNGPGIDKDQQQKILMPFYTTKTDGMGMGLSISRSLLEAHGGSLYFESEPGHGSTFYFTLPTREKSAKS
ncbi:PAS domain S-box protein [Methylomicrobium lacus]|uniref:PAS domain S-box protein n=1 Tax=Methylomicrobium lacus TaxID=136992 RepID=UPI0035A86057